MQDRRTHPRIPSRLKAVAFYREGNKEYNCEIANISETGLCLEFLGAKCVSFNKGDLLIVQFCDRFIYGDRLENPRFILRAIVRHIEKRGKDVFAGCYVSNKTFLDYVKKKGLLAYEDSMLKAERNIHIGVLPCSYQQQE